MNFTKPYLPNPKFPYETLQAYNTKLIKVPSGKRCDWEDQRHLNVLEGEVAEEVDTLWGN